MKILIVGGVAGGASAAARLRRLDEKAEIILFDRGEYISYANCGLPYYIGNVITNPKALTVQTPKRFNFRFNVDVRVNNLVRAINPKNKVVTVLDLTTNKTYEESYDKLILSPGAEPIEVPTAIQAQPFVFSLRNIPDTFKIKEFIEEKQPKSAIIIGGGYIGIEMAENLILQNIKVTLIQRSNHVIKPLDLDMASQVHHYLRQKGVNLILSNPLKEVLPDKKGIKVILQNGEILGDMVIYSLGVRPESDLAQAAGLETNKKGAIIVNSHMQTSDQNIYAIGDAIEVSHFVTGDKVSIPLAGPANKQGRIVADNICGIPSTYNGTQGSSILKFLDLVIATTGINETYAQLNGLNYDKIYLFPSSHAEYYPEATSISIKVIFEKPSGKILGAQLIGFDGVDKRCDLLATAIRAGMTASDLKELELCYAPPFGSAKDPINMIGFMIENLLTKKIFQFHWDQVNDLPRDDSLNLLDVRSAKEYKNGYIDGFINISVDRLREQLSKLDQHKPTYVYCETGLRSYIACRILSQNGFECYNLAGGYELYSTLQEL